MVMIESEVVLELDDAGIEWSRHLESMQLGPWLDDLVEISGKEAASQKITYPHCTSPIFATMLSFTSKSPETPDRCTKVTYRTDLPPQHRALPLVLL